MLKSKGVSTVNCQNHCQYKCQKGGNFPKLSIIVGVVTGVSDVSDVFVFVFVFVCHCQVTKIVMNLGSQLSELLDSIAVSVFVDFLTLANTETAVATPLERM